MSDRTRHRRHDPRRRGPSLYEHALDKSDREILALAQDVDGVDDEVDVLRLIIHRALERQAEDPRVLFAGIRLLVQALTARHRLTDREATNLSDAVARVFDQFVSAVGAGSAEADHEVDG